MPTTLETFNAAKFEPAMYPHDARVDAARFSASKTIAKGTVLGKHTANDRLEAYDDASTFGVETAVGICMHDIITDSSGNVYFGTNAVASSVNLPHRTAPIYIAGVFDTALMTGWNAAAAADLRARTLNSGFVRIP